MTDYFWMNADTDAPDGQTDSEAFIDYWQNTLSIFDVPYRISTCNHIDKCNKKSHWGYEFGYPLFCGKHKLENMTECVNKICEHTGCAKQAHFGYEGQLRQFCGIHRLVNMENSSITKCAECKKQAVFGIQGQKASHCGDHRTENMINLKNKTCANEDCKKLPTYNFQGQKKSLYCNDHKLNGMVNVKNLRCQKENCNKQPRFGYQGTKKALYCKAHAGTGMVNVKCKSCAELDCNTKPFYGIPGTTPTHCSKHKQYSMIYLKRIKCLEGGCNNPAINGTPGNYATHCNIHKLMTQINLVERRCTGCEMLNVLIADNKCSICNTDFMAHKQTNKLAKQNLIEAVLRENGIQFICDKRISVNGDAGCTTTKRPDFLIQPLTGTHWVIIEVDEHQHNRYGCDVDRMVTVRNELQGKGIFIRFNPDSFTIGN